MRDLTKTELPELTEAELDLVSGGIVGAGNTGNTPTSTAQLGNGAPPPIGNPGTGGGTAIAIGAAASNTAVVGQLNLVSFRRG